jgi:hypothetical protein
MCRWDLEIGLSTAPFLVRWDRRDTFNNNSKVDHNDARDRLESIETIQDNVLIVTVFIPSDQGTYSTSSNRKINAISCTCFCRSFWWTMHVTWKHGPATGH